MLWIEIFYSFRIDIIMSLLYRQSKDTVKNTNFRTFRGTKKGVKSVFFFILKLIKGHEPDMVYLHPCVCFCRPWFS